MNEKIPINLSGSQYYLQIWQVLLHLGKIALSPGFISLCLYFLYILNNNSVMLTVSCFKQIFLKICPIFLIVLSRKLIQITYSAIVGNTIL